HEECLASRLRNPVHSTVETQHLRDVVVLKERAPGQGRGEGHLGLQAYKAYSEMALRQMNFILRVLPSKHIAGGGPVGQFNAPLHPVTAVIFTPAGGYAPG